MGKTCHDTHKNGFLKALAQCKCLLYHIVSLLLVGWFKDRNHGKLAIEARILFVLTGMHRGIVGSQNNKATIATGNS